MKNVQLEYSKEFKSKLVFGSILKKDFFVNYNLEIEKGRYPRENEKSVVIIGPRMADDFFKKDISVGSNIYISKKNSKL